MRGSVDTTLTWQRHAGHGAATPNHDACAPPRTTVCRAQGQGGFASVVVSPQALNAIKARHPVGHKARPVGFDDGVVPVDGLGDGTERAPKHGMPGLFTSRAAARRPFSEHLRVLDRGC